MRRMVVFVMAADKAQFHSSSTVLTTHFDGKNHALAIQEGGAFVAASDGLSGNIYDQVVAGVVSISLETDLKPTVRTQSNSS